MTLTMSGPAALKGTAATLTTAAFTPAVNDILIMSGIFDTATAANKTVPSTLTGSSSAWTRVEDTAVTNGEACIYWAKVLSASSTTVKATFATSSDNAIDVNAFTGADTVTPIGNHGNGVLSANPTVISYTASTRPGSICVIAVEDYNGGVVTVTNATTDIALVAGTDGSDGKLLHQTTPATAGQSVSFSISGVTNSAAYAWAEILPAASSSGFTGWGLPI